MGEKETGFLAPKSPSATSMATTMTLTDPTSAPPAASGAKETTATTSEKSRPSSAGGSINTGEAMEKSSIKEDAEKTHVYGEDKNEYPGMVALAFITLALCLAVFLVALDQTIIATAIPKITGLSHFTHHHNDLCLWLLTTL